MFGYGFLIDLGLLSVASGSLALLITHSQVTRSLRYRFVDAPLMIGELINCPFCVSFWTSLVAASLLWDGSMVHFVVLWLAIAGLSSFFAGALLHLFLFRESENEALREMLTEARVLIKDALRPTPQDQ